MSITSKVASEYAYFPNMYKYEKLLACLKRGPGQYGIDLEGTWKNFDSTIDMTSEQMQETILDISLWLEKIAYSFKQIDAVWLCGAHRDIHRMMILVLCALRKQHKIANEDPKSEPKVASVPLAFGLLHKGLEELEKSGVYERIRETHAAYTKNHEMDFFRVFSGC
jgi:hypothetical protein